VAHRLPWSGAPLQEGVFMESLGVRSFCMMAAAGGWTDELIADQTGKVVVITGANSGLGLASALALAGHGAEVVLACRSPERGEAALAQVRAAATAADPVLVTLDLGDLGSVAKAADELGSRVEKIDVLMNNAGIMAVPYARTVDGFESQFGTNHLGHFALTGRILALVASAPSPRIVTTSSFAHWVGRIRWHDPNWEQSYRKWEAYGQSKLANLLFAFELDRRAGSHGSSVISVAAHPGYASTHLQTAGPQLEGSRWKADSAALANRLFAQPAASGAWPQLFAATAAGVVGGDFFGPDRLLGMRGHPKRTWALAKAYDPQASRRLWELSEALTGVVYDWPPSPRRAAH
jgi:NAD(P)-dependent dehydrogenase (short-subunit alcohol dehydrogenase family)